MSNIINNSKEVLHRIRVRLHAVSLPGIEGKYLARTVNEASLTIEQVCTALKSRGGFTGNYEDLTENVRQFFDELAYQLCDGFAVNTGYFTVYPNVGGTFENEWEAHDLQKNPVSFRFKPLYKLRRLAEEITVSVEGVADASGRIDEFLDVDEDEINGIFVPGDQFVISGNKIKIAGDNPNVGLYFVPADNPANAVKVTRIAENSPTKIIGIAPQTGSQMNKIEIRTQYLGSTSVFLKTPRIITSGFILEEA
jgi:hypothetical protein